MKKKKIVLIISGIILVLSIFAGFYVWKKYYQKITESIVPIVPVKESTESLGGQIYEEIKNPAAEIPQTNPYETKTNPFEAKINPFKEVYKNPFQ